MRTTPAAGSVAERKVWGKRAVEPGKRGEHRRSLRRVGVCPWFGKGLKGRAPAPDLMHNIEKVARGAPGGRCA
jgi:hypothetical protein